ncbi:MAG: hypothetical protein ACE5H2_00585 [Terriglobia bacterium]
MIYRTPEIEFFVAHDYHHPQHLLDREFSGAAIDRLRLEETSANAFEFAGDKEGQR